MPSTSKAIIFFMSSVSLVVNRPPFSPPAAWLQTILEKKVSKISLNCLQNFVHWFLMTFSRFYPSYKDFYTRIRNFSNGVLLVDLTNDRIVGVANKALRRMAPSSNAFHFHECLTLKNCGVAFFNDGAGITPFAEGYYGIKRIEVSDVNQDDKIIKVRFQTQSSQKEWLINRNLLYDLSHHGYRELVYFGVPFSEALVSAPEPSVENLVIPDREDSQPALVPNGETVGVPFNEAWVTVPQPSDEDFTYSIA